MDFEVEDATVFGNCLLDTVADKYSLVLLSKFIACDSSHKNRVHDFFYEKFKSNSLPVRAGSILRDLLDILEIYTAVYDDLSDFVHDLLHVCNLGHAPLVWSDHYYLGQRAVFTAGTLLFDEL